MRWIALVLVAGCSGGEGDKPADATETGASLPIPACAEIVASEPVVCASPASPTDPWFTRRQAPMAADLTEALLTSGGVAAGDFDGDGDLDLFLPHEASSQIYVQQGPEDWVEDGAPRLAGIDLSAAVGAVSVDADGDGDLDLFVTRYNQPSKLLSNNGAGVFSDVTERAGLSSAALRTQSSSWADIDLDGDLDLFVGRYGPKPETFDGAFEPADPAELWINQGDGTFVDASDWLPQDVHDGYTFMSAFFDVTGDHYPELFTFHDFGTTPGVNRKSRVLENLGGTGFRELGGTNFDREFEDMGVGVADLNDDLVPDFALTSWKKVNLLISSGTPGSPLWVRSADAWGLVVDPASRNQVYGWGADFGDVDNDGDEDLALGFGYWSTYDSAGDPLNQWDGLWTQNAGGFEDVAASPRYQVDDSGITRGVVWLDLDGNGFLDLVKRQLDGPTLQYLAGCDDSSWIEIEVRQASKNPFGVGTRISVESGDSRQTRWIEAGSTSMYSGKPPMAHVGLGSAETVDVEVQWPDGEICRVEQVPTRRHVTLERRAPFLAQ